MSTSARFLPNVLLIFSAQALLPSAALAVVDAGAIQQNLEKQVPLLRTLPEPGKEKPTLPAASKDTEVNFVVNAFSLEGVSILPEAQVQAVLKPYLGIQLTFSELEKACDAITNLYRNLGYSVQVVVVPQSMSQTGGTVKLRITEAKLSSVVISVLGGDNRFGAAQVERYITNANPIGQPLNFNSIERSLIILNETPGVMVSSQLDAGKEQGDTDLKVSLSETRLTQSRIESNNSGSRSTGTYQIISALSLNNVTGIGDQLALNGIGSQGSQYIQGTYSRPIATDGLRLSIYGTRLMYENVGSYASPNGAYGNALTQGLNFSYALVRTKSANLNATLGYDVKRYLNQLISTNTTNSAYNINNVVAGLSGNAYDSLGGNAVSNGSASITFGRLDILPTSMTGYGAHTPSQFTKLSFSGSRNQSLDEVGKSSLFLSLSGQFASANLNSGEQFYLGGPYGVRAYPVSQGGGAQGALLAAEYRQQLPDNLTASVFFDAGIVQQYKNPFKDWQGKTNANNTYSLMGSGIGMKWSEGNWNVAGSIAWRVRKNPLYSQTGQAVNNDGLVTQPRGWINVSYSF
jgi:hemolysin activation/secretion protein